MSFSIGSEQYPPNAFCNKYGKFLAPHGQLLAPVQVLANKKLGQDADCTLRKAFKITLKKIAKQRNSCAQCDVLSGKYIVIAVILTRMEYLH